MSELSCESLIGIDSLIPKSVGMTVVLSAARGVAAVLRERYARGEISHEKSGRCLGWLIRTEPGQQPGPGGGRG